MNGYSLYLIYGVLALGVILYAIYYFKAFKCIRNGNREDTVHAVEHQTIKQEIKLADGKLVALEIRVKVLEDK